MRKSLGSLGLAALLAVFSAYAAEDVGLVNQIAGDVSYTSGGATSKAKPYMKIREGDRFSVPAGAQLRIVYFQGGRQEAFSGPAALTTGKAQSSVQNGGQPQISTLPSGVPQKIAQTPELVA